MSKDLYNQCIDAINNNNSDSVITIINSGIDINCRDEHSKTPLQIALTTHCSLEIM